MSRFYESTLECVASYLDSSKLDICSEKRGTYSMRYGQISNDLKAIDIFNKIITTPQEKRPKWFEQVKKELLLL